MPKRGTLAADEIELDAEQEKIVETMEAMGFDSRERARMAVVCTGNNIGAAVDLYWDTDELSRQFDEFLRGLKKMKKLSEQPDRRSTRAHKDFVERKHSPLREETPAVSPTGVSREEAPLPTTTGTEGAAASSTAPTKRGSPLAPLSTAPDREEAAASSTLLPEEVAAASTAPQTGAEQSPAQLVTERARGTLWKYGSKISACIRQDLSQVSAESRVDIVSNFLRFCLTSLSPGEHSLVLKSLQGEDADATRQSASSTCFSAAGQSSRHRQPQGVVGCVATGAPSARAAAAPPSSPAEGVATCAPSARAAAAAPSSPAEGVATCAPAARAAAAAPSSRRAEEGFCLPAAPSSEPAEIRFDVLVKTMSSRTLTISTSDAMLVGALKREVHQKMCEAAEETPLAPHEQRLVVSGTALDDSRPLSAYNIQKGATLHLLRAGRRLAPHEAPPAASDAAEAAEAHELRIRPCNGEPEFDGSDGWAVMEGVEVRGAQQWYRSKQASLLWEDWKNGNQLVYLLNRESAYHAEAGSFLEEKMRHTALGSASKWHSVPQCLLQIDAQLRAVLKDPRHAELPLLGGAADGTFALGYVQLSKMPAPLPPCAGSVARAPAAPTGRGLGLHCDSAAYGDVIVTVTLFGEVEITLRNAPGMRTQLRGAERGNLTSGGAVRVRAGEAYALWGKARWKMEHDAVVPPTCTPAAALGDTARVGVTFRYFRRTFLQLRAARAADAVGRDPPPPPPLPAPFELVDAPFYVCGKLAREHLYTYPAVVLRVDAAAAMLTLLYLSDGLGADTDWEAFSISERVPAQCVFPASAAVKRILSYEGCAWTVRSQRLVEQIRDEGVEAYLARELRASC
ncbi:hypothetical protein AB1Y20_015571 [Prymnesium parvum]|uniref:Ubiquitin-like domain-containing protein n=1 Tax=Prymnesium parvum TaxID=97485 RepID=A0AB34JYV4_PRYPA